MIYRIVNPDGSIAMSMDYPNPSVPLRYLKDGQQLYQADDYAALHIDETKLMVVDNEIQQAFIGPVQTPFAGVGEVLTLVTPPVDQYLAVPMMGDPKVLGLFIG